MKKILDLFKKEYEDLSRGELEPVKKPYTMKAEDGVNVRVVGVFTDFQSKVDLEKKFNLEDLKDGDDCLIEELDGQVHKRKICLKGYRGTGYKPVGLYTPKTSEKYRKTSMYAILLLKWAYGFYKGTHIGFESFSVTVDHEVKGIKKYDNKTNR